MYDECGLLWRFISNACRDDYYLANSVPVFAKDYIPAIQPIGVEILCDN